YPSWKSHDVVPMVIILQTTRRPRVNTPRPPDNAVRCSDQRLWWTPLSGSTISEADPQSWLLAVERDDRRDAQAGGRGVCSVIVKPDALALGRADVPSFPKEDVILANQLYEPWEVALSDLPLHMRLEGGCVGVAFIRIEAIGVLLVLNDIEG